MDYYKPCKEYDECNRLIEEYFNTKQYEKCFKGHLALAEIGYPLAECQVGYFYYEGLGTKKDVAKAFYWTQKAAEHGDRDGQFNLAWFYEEGIGTGVEFDKAKYWYQCAAILFPMSKNLNQEVSRILMKFFQVLMIILSSWSV